MKTSELSQFPEGAPASEVFESLGLDPASVSKKFGPNAYFDKHMDCIFVKLRDCSITEVRVSEYLTFLFDNHPNKNQSNFAGLKIKGIKHIFKTLDIELEGIIAFTDFWDAFAKEYPSEVERAEEEHKESVADLIHIAAETELVIELDEAA